jgi:hypothetical protein
MKLRKIHGVRCEQGDITLIEEHNNKVTMAMRAEEITLSRDEFQSICDLNYRIEWEGGETA